MGKWMKRGVCLLALFMIFMLPVLAEESTTDTEITQAEEKNSLRIESVRTNMPDLWVYLMGGEVNSNELSAQLSQQELAVGGVNSFADSEESLTYYLLIDISASMPSDYVSEMKVALKSFLGGLNSNETYKMITFGDSVTQIMNGEETPEQQTEIIDTLSCDNQNTQLFEAFQLAVQLAKQDGGVDAGRKVVFVFTDGMDDTVGKSTSNEALRELVSAGLPVYGITFSGDNNIDAVNQFGEFVRSSNGELTILEPVNFEQELAHLKEKLYQAQVVYLAAPNNRLPDEGATLTLAAKERNWSQTIEPGFELWQPDTVSPRIETVTPGENNQYTVVFSEEVEGAEQNGNFEFVSGDGTVYVPVSSKKTDGITYILTFRDTELPSGTMTVRCSNVVDVSMEQNLVENEGMITLEGDTTPPEVSSMEQLSNTQIRVIFTEAVTGLDNENSYTLKDEDGNEYFPASVKAEGDDSVLLNFSSELYTGNYILVCTGIRDVSKEANVIANNDLVIEIDGVQHNKFLEFWEKWKLYLITGALLLLILVLVLVWLCFYRRVKKNKGMIMIDGKLTPVSEVDVKQHIKIESPDSQNIILYIRSKGNNEVKLDRMITSSMIFGRSEICDVFVDDPKISKQHFAIEHENGKLMLADLESTNGTKLNGIPVRGQVPLNNNDVISVGDLSIRVEF